MKQIIVNYSDEDRQIDRYEQTDVDNFGKTEIDR